MLVAEVIGKSRSESSYLYCLVGTAFAGVPDTPCGPSEFQRRTFSFEVHFAAMRSAPVVAFTHPEIVELVELASTGKTPSDNAAIAIIETEVDLECFLKNGLDAFMMIFFT